MDDETPRRVNAEAAARAERAAELRVAGATWSQIAAQTGYRHATHCRRAVMNHLGQLPQPDREASREVWRRRVEALWSEAYRDVLDRRPGAVRAAAAVSQRAAALDGLDAPTHLQLHTPSEAEYAAVLHRMIELDQAARGLTVGTEADIFSDRYLEAEVVEDGAGALAPTTTYT